MRRLALVLPFVLAVTACEVAPSGTGASDTSTTADVVTDTTLAADVANPAGCPSSEPTPNGPCAGTDTCRYGQECCGGECSASFVCTCAGGSWACYYTDVCLRPGCPDAVAADVAGETSASPDAWMDDASDATAGGDAADATYGDVLKEASEACPAEAPLGVQGVTCMAGQRCEYGQECCCGACAPSMVCECWAGAWGCHSTDFCLIPGCPDDPPPDGSCRADGDCQDMASCRRPDEPTPCGICRHPGFDDMLIPCQADAECNAGFVCEAVAPPNLCLCEPASLCQPACGGADNGCPSGQTCVAGHCRAQACTADADCPTFFACDGSAGACLRLHCALDADCGPGHCVDGACYPDFGVCQLPVP